MIVSILSLIMGYVLIKLKGYWVLRGLKFIKGVLYD